MKKIIELAEKVCEVFDHPFDEYLEAVNALKTALAERKALEQTPITEDWLKEHGFEVHEGLRGFIPAPYANRHIGKDYLEYDIRRKSLKIFSDYEEGDGVYSDFYCENIDTVAKLLDALDLCGIKID